MSKVFTERYGVPLPPLEPPSVPPDFLEEWGWQGAPRSLAEAHAQTPEALRQWYIQDPIYGHYLRNRRHLLLQNMPHAEGSVQQRVLAWLRDHVDPNIPRAYYKAVLGHDLHIGTFGTLHMQHYHAHFRDPFTGKLGWWENVGLVSQGKVGISFRDFEIDQFQNDSTLYGDFKYHEVGLGVVAEANTDTALGTTTAIARVAGTQTEVTADVYRTVATITADTTETWTEHGVFNTTSGATLMDRSIMSPTAAVVNLDTVQFTYSCSKVAES